MRDILATRIATTSYPESSARWTPRVLLEGTSLAEESKAFLAGEMQICLEGAFELYIDARSQGYRPGSRRLDPVHGDSWHRCSAPKIESAKRAWMRALGNPFFSDIEWEDVVPALEKIRNLPKYHGKRRSGGAGHEGGLGEEMPATDRISTSTFLRFGRTVRKVGDLLVDLELAEKNPFDICSWSIVEEARLRQEERPVDRRAWSDAADSYLSSLMFTGDVTDFGDPLFWIPLLMRLAGLRLDEAVHLKVNDLMYRDGMPVLCIDCEGKTPAGRRLIPVSQRLQNLGLVGLLELRRNQKETALFPQLAGGRPGAGTNRFRKDFIRYCETNGIDATALHAHDFRKALQVALLLQGHSCEVVDAVLGHDRHRRPVHFDEVSRDAVRDALEMIGGDFPGIVSPFK